MESSSKVAGVTYQIDNLPIISSVHSYQRFDENNSEIFESIEVKCVPTPWNVPPVNPPLLQQPVGQAKEFQPFPPLAGHPPPELIQACQPIPFERSYPMSRSQLSHQFYPPVQRHHWPPLHMYHQTLEHIEAVEHTKRWNESYALYQQEIHKQYMIRQQQIQQNFVTAAHANRVRSQFEMKVENGLVIPKLTRNQLESQFFKNYRISADLRLSGGCKKEFIEEVDCLSDNSVPSCNLFSSSNEVPLIYTTASKEGKPFDADIGLSLDDIAALQKCSKSTFQSWPNGSPEVNHLITPSTEGNKASNDVVSEVKNYIGNSAVNNTFNNEVCEEKNYISMNKQLTNVRATASERDKDVIKQLTDFFPPLPSFQPQVSSLLRKLSFKTSHAKTDDATITDNKSTSLRSKTEVYDMEFKNAQCFDETKNIFEEFHKLVGDGEPRIIKSYSIADPFAMKRLTEDELTVVDPVAMKRQTKDKSSVVDPFVMRRLTEDKSSVVDPFVIRRLTEDESTAPTTEKKVSIKCQSFKDNIFCETHNGVSDIKTEKIVGVLNCFPKDKTSHSVKLNTLSHVSHATIKTLSPLSEVKYNINTSNKNTTYSELIIGKPKTTNIHHRTEKQSTLHIVIPKVDTESVGRQTTQKNSNIMNKGTLIQDRNLFNNSKVLCSAVEENNYQFSKRKRTVNSLRCNTKDFPGRLSPMSTVIGNHAVSHKRIRRAISSNRLVANDINNVSDHFKHTQTFENLKKCNQVKSHNNEKSMLVSNHSADLTCSVPVPGEPEPHSVKPNDHFISRDKKKLTAVVNENDQRQEFDRNFFSLFHSMFPK